MKHRADSELGSLIGLLLAVVLAGLIAGTAAALWAAWTIAAGLLKLAEILTTYGG